MEIGIIVALLAIYYFSGARKGWGIVSGGGIVSKQGTDPDTGRNWMDIALFLLLLAALGCEIVFKIRERKLIFISQPCYMAMIFYCIVLWSKNPVLQQRCFCLAFASIYGQIAAIFMAPDHKAAGRNCFDIMMYSVAHYMLVLVPVYLLVVRDFRFMFTRPGAGSFWATFCVLRCWDAFYHFCVLLPLGLVFKINFNCMISPLESWPDFLQGPNYRMVVYALSVVMSLLFTATYVGLSMGLSCLVSKSA